MFSARKSIMKIRKYKDTSTGICVAVFKKTSYLAVGLITAVSLMAASMPSSIASAQTASSPTGPTKRFIVRYNNVLGSNTVDPASSLSGFIEKEKSYTNLPYAVYTADIDGQNALENSGVALEVFEDEVLELYGDVPIPTIGGDAGTGTFTDTVSSLTYDGSGYAVAIIDTGIDKNHTSLAGQVIHEACFGTNDAPSNLTSVCPGGAEFSSAVDSGLDCDASISGCGHGTFSASAAAMLPSLVDIDSDTVEDELSGSAPGAGLISLRIGTTSTNILYCGLEPTCVVPLTSNILSALDYLITLDVGVPIAAANMSFGGGNYANETECQQNSSYSSFSSAFSQLISAGIAPVAATGNGGANSGEENTIGSPACVEGAVAVGATNILGDTIASYSNNGSLTDLLAPGGDYDGLNDDTLLWLAVNESANSFTGTQGTSFSTPMTAGVYAVLREKHPNASVDQLTQLLQDTGTDIADARTDYTVSPKKRINVDIALSSSTFPVIDSFTGPAGTVNENVDIELTVTTTDTASCSLDNGVGSVDVSGGTLTVPGKEDYNLTCTGDFNDTTTSLFSASTFNSAPTQPNLGEALSVTSDSEARSATISWNASEDTDGIDFYQVYLDDELIDTTTETSFTFTDLALELEYTARVSAVDTLGAVSTASADQTFVLAAVTVPTAPDTGLSSVFGSLGNNMFMSVGALLTTAGALVTGRKFF